MATPAFTYFAKDLAVNGLINGQCSNDVSYTINISGRPYNWSDNYSVFVNGVGCTNNQYIYYKTYNLTKQVATVTNRNLSGVNFLNVTYIYKDSVGSVTQTIVKYGNSSSSYITLEDQWFDIYQSFSTLAEISIVAEVVSDSELDTFILSTEITGNGSIQKDGTVISPDGVYIDNTKVRFRAVADNGWNFVRWGGDVQGTFIVQNLIMTSDKNVTALFQADPEPPAPAPIVVPAIDPTYSLTITGATGGILISSGGCGSVISGQSCIVSPEPTMGVNFVVSATADSGYFVNRFIYTSGLSVSVNASNPRQQTLTINNNNLAEVSVTAEFLADPCSVNLLIDKESFDQEHGKIKISVPNLGDDFSYGSKFVEVINPAGNSPITIIARPDSNFAVKSFVIDNSQVISVGDSGTFSSSGNDKGVYVDIAGSTSKKIAVRFEEYECAPEDQFILNIDTYGSGSISPISGRAYCRGDVVSVSPIPAIGWTFTGWTFPNSSDFKISGNNLLITMSGDKTSGIIASFQEVIAPLSSSTQSVTSVSIKSQSSTMFYCPSETYKDNIVAFSFINNNENPSVGNNYHFRINFYTDLEKKKLVYSAFSLADNKRWFLNNEFFSQLPSTGLDIVPFETVNIVYDPEVLSSQITEFQKPNFINNNAVIYEKPLICGIKYYVEAQAYELSTNTITNIETIPLMLDCNRVDSYYWNYNKDKNNWLCSGQGKTDLKVSRGSGQSINSSIDSDLFGIFKIVWQGRRSFNSNNDTIRTNNIYSALWDSNKDLLYSSGQGLYDILEITEVNHPVVLTDLTLNFYITGATSDIIKYKACPLPSVTSSIDGISSTSNFARFCYPGELTLLSSVYDNVKMRVYKEDIVGSLVINDEKVVPVVNKKSIRLDVDGIAGAYAVRIKNMEDNEWGGWVNIDRDLFVASGEVLTGDDEKHDAYRIDNSRFLVQCDIEKHNGLRRICCQVLTLYGISNTFCIEILSNFEVAQHIFKFYVNEERTVEFPIYNGQYVLSLEADGVTLNSDGTSTVYFDAIFSEPVYSNETNSTIYIVDEVKFNVVQQGINDLRNQYFKTITSNKFSGQFKINKNDGIFNKDGSAFIEIIFPNVSSSETCGSDERDNYNFINADDEEISNIDLLPEEVYSKYQRNRLSKAIDINKFKQNYDKDDINFKFGNPGYFRE